MIAKLTDKRTAGRELAEQILIRSAHLDPADRALLQQVLDKQVRCADVAAVAGRSTRTVQRRVAAMIRRLTDPAVVYILRHHRRWDPVTAQVALAVRVRHWTLRQTAQHLDLSLHQVRQHIERVKTLTEAYAARATGPPNLRNRMRAVSTTTSAASPF